MDYSGFVNPSMALQSHSCAPGWLSNGSQKAASRVIAIRRRPGGRLYGYFGRTQVSWSEATYAGAPFWSCGVKVVRYVQGGRLPEAEADE